jgi:HK97 family phage major capsid protein
MDTKEMRQKRAALVEQARKLLDAAEAEKRELTAEEEQQYDKIMAEVDGLKDKIEREERLQGHEGDLNRSLREPTRPEPGGNGQGQVVEYRGMKIPAMTAEQRAALTSYLRGGFGALGREEMRALQAGSDIAGGYIVAPQEFVTTLIKAVDNLVVIRQLATVYPLATAESLGVPVLDADPADADWTTELATGSEDSTMAFGKRELRPHPMAKRIKVSNKLLRQSVLDTEALVRDRLAYKFAVTQEKGFMTGSGAQQPLGIFTASNNGISTGRDVSTDNTTTAITADNLINVKFTLKQNYWPRARWIFHRDAVKMIRKLKDSQDQYLWQPGIAANIPDRILETPYLISEYAPNTFTAALYVGIIGDFSFYWIVDALDMQVQRLVELYAETNQVGFIGRAETDGMPVLEEAFVRVKLAAS